MKRIASIALVALMLLASADVFAQGLQGRNRRGSYTPGEAGVGLTFGYANSSYRTRDRATDETENTGLLHGFTAGITKDFTLMPHALYFQTGSIISIRMIRATRMLLWQDRLSSL